MVSRGRLKAEVKEVLGEYSGRNKWIPWLSRISSPRDSGLWRIRAPGEAESRHEVFGSSWPWAWYLRCYTGLHLGEPEPGFEPVEGSVLLVNEENSASVSLAPELFSPGVPYQHRWWFPESYRGLGLPDLVHKLVDPGAWSDWRSYFIDRTPRGELGSVLAAAYFPRDFPLSQVLSQAVSPQP